MQKGCLVATKIWKGQGVKKKRRGWSALLDNWSPGRSLFRLWSCVIKWVGGWMCCGLEACLHVTVTGRHQWGQCITPHWLMSTSDSCGYRVVIYTTLALSAPQTSPPTPMHSQPLPQPPPPSPPSPLPIVQGPSWLFHKLAPSTGTCWALQLLMIISAHEYSQYAACTVWGHKHHVVQVVYMTEDGLSDLLVHCSHSMISNLVL